MTVITIASLHVASKGDAVSNRIVACILIVGMLALFIKMCIDDHKGK